MGERIVPEYVATFGSELLVTPVNPLLSSTVITIDDLPWTGYLGPGASQPSPHVFTKTLMDPSSDHFCMLVRIEPGGTGPSHWHLSDTIYIPRRGELHIPGEGVYREGDIRSVKGGYAYGGGSPGPTGSSSSSSVSGRTAGLIPTWTRLRSGVGTSRQRHDGGVGGGGWDVAVPRAVA